MMKTYTFNYRVLLLIALYVFNAVGVFAQKDDTTKLFHREPIDTSTRLLNMDYVYNRPFLTAGKLPIAIGGYLEANSQYVQIDGVNEGLSFQARRLTIFLSSTIAKRIKFLSEIEFEGGANEINIEFAAVDIEFLPLLNLRGGIIMNPIGAFNQNHDGPRWDFIDRPISATTIIPSTLSNVGFGLHGKHFTGNWVLGYEAYITNGFNDKIISNDFNRTSLESAKSSPERFEENNSGLPTFTGKLAIRNRKYGEIGLSYLSGVYNKWQSDGIILDEKRKVQILAVDFNTSVFKKRINIVGEAAQVFVNIPETYLQQYGNKQFGAFVDIMGTVFQGRSFDWQNTKLNIGIRLEYADYNQGVFKETKGNIFDDVWAIVPSVAFRPAGTTVLRFNYRYQQQRDILGNPPSKTGAIQLGISTYF